MWSGCGQGMQVRSRDRSNPTWLGVLGAAPRPSLSLTGVHQQGPGPALRVPIGPRGPAGTAGPHPARVGGYLRGAGRPVVCPRPTSHSPRATLICAWAEEGADAIGPNGELVHSDAFPPETLVDTLGAGDTFNAAVIFALAEGGHKHGTATTWPWFSLAWPRPSHSTATSHPGPHPQGGPCRMPSPSAAGSRAGNVGSRASMALSELVPGDLCTLQAHHTSTAPSNAPIKPYLHHYCLLCPLAVPSLPWLWSHCPWDALTTAKVHSNASISPSNALQRPLGPGSLATGHPPATLCPEQGREQPGHCIPQPALPTPPHGPSRLGLPALQELQSQGLPLPLWHQYRGLWPQGRLLPPRPQHWEIPPRGIPPWGLHPQDLQSGGLQSRGLPVLGFSTPGPA